MSFFLKNTDGVFCFKFKTRIFVKNKKNERFDNE
jgi:hypothetical protein